MFRRLSERRAKRRDAMHYLMTGGRRWQRIEATVLLGTDALALADAEQELVRDVEARGWSMEFIGGDFRFRAYRVTTAEEPTCSA